MNRIIKIARRKREAVRVNIVRVRRSRLESINRDVDTHNIFRARLERDFLFRRHEGDTDRLVRHSGTRKREILVCFPDALFNLLAERLVFAHLNQELTHQFITFIL